MNRMARAGGDHRRRLLAALSVTVAEHGLDGLTVARIVRHARVGNRYFYTQFEDKWDCLAVAYEAAHERLHGVLMLRCYTNARLADRVEAGLSAGLDLLATEPGLARLIAVEAPGAGGELAVRHHEWLRRYGSLLRLAAIGAEVPASPRRSIEPAIAAGVAARIAAPVRAGEAKRLPELAPELVAYVLSFFPHGEPASAHGFPPPPPAVALE
jgi:AcrR family transcriptional regulator